MMSRIKPTSDHFTTRQIVWIIAQSIGSIGISFGALYGLSLLLFSPNPPPTLWDFPVPLAGNYGVTALTLTLTNWIICGALQTLDVINGIVEPLNQEAIRIWPNQYSRLYWWLFTTDLVVSPPIGVFKLPSQLTMCKRITNTLIRSIPWIVYTFIIVWPIFTGFSYYFWGNDGYNSYPLPQYLCASFAAVCALVTTPIWSIMTLISMGAIQAHQNDNRLIHSFDETSVDEDEKENYDKIDIEGDLERNFYDDDVTVYVCPEKIVL